MPRFDPAPVGPDVFRAVARRSVRWLSTPTNSRRASHTGRSPRSDQIPRRSTAAAGAVAGTIVAIGRASSARRGPAAAIPARASRDTVPSRRSSSSTTQNSDAARPATDGIASSTAQDPRSTTSRISASAGVAPAQNLLTNSTFDHDITGWQLLPEEDTVTLDHRTAVGSSLAGGSGPGSLEITMHFWNGSAGGCFEDVPVTAGVEYLAEASVMIPVDVDQHSGDAVYIAGS